MREWMTRFAMICCVPTLALLSHSSAMALDETATADEQADETEEKRTGEYPEEMKQAPDTYKVKFETTAGDFIVEVTREWAPLGADHFYNAVEAGFYDETRFFRNVPGFIVQWGINGDPKVQQKWRENPIKDDDVVVSNLPGYITYATAGPNTRTTQLFINFQDNSGLDRQGFSPFGRVIEGMENVEKITAKYGERPDQGAIQFEGNEYLKSRFPDMDYIKTARVMKDEETEKESAGDDANAKKKDE